MVKKIISFDFQLLNFIFFYQNQQHEFRNQTKKSGN